jgi:2,4-didehydro-3-deoxy-L-rhamnonate hydrolase
MRLIRWGTQGAEHPGVMLDDGTILDVTEFGSDFTEEFFATGGLAQLRHWLSFSPRCTKLPPSERLGPPICRPSKIICIGLNFRDHAKESGLPLPEEPVIFLKATSSLCGPNDPVTIPKNGKKLDWEVELAFVVARRAVYVDEAHAPDYIAGFVLHNDYSERGFQLERGGQWVKGKSADNFAPLGPFLATKDEMPDVSNLHMWLKVNGKFRQTSSTAEMIFSVPYLLSYVSQFMTLLPGDVISTGTPAGVGLGMNPPEYLQEGDIVELGIEGLGSSRQLVASCSRQ